ncbi:MAG TPA: ATP-binding protein [Roseovarius sp.]
MAALAIMVGVAAIGVNRYLVRTQDDLVRTTLPAIELASRIGAEAEVIGSLESAFVQAGTREDLDRIAAALRQAVTGIEAGAQGLDALSPNAPGVTEGVEAQAIVARMTDDARRELLLAARIRTLASEVAQGGARLDTLVEAEIDLARLRITAGIADLYAPPYSDPRAALDALADRYFFAFERLTELAGLIDTARLQFQALPMITAPDDLQAARDALSASLTKAQRRAAFLPTPSASAEAAELLARQQQALSEGGLLELQGDRIALQSSIAQDRVLLREIIMGLSERARQTRDSVQASGLAQIEATQKRSSLMALGLLGLVGFAVVAGAVLLLYARKQLVARLGNISRRIVAVASGDYGAPVAISGHDEIGRLEKALNILRRRARDAARLRDSLEEAVIARTGDVVAEMQASDAARAEAEAASRSKTEFLARMSHEIRTPLNGIIGMLDLLDAETADAGRKARTRTALNSARELLDITNDILNFAGSENTAGRRNAVHFNLREFIGQMGHQLQSLAAPKGLEVAIDMAQTAPMTVLGDVVKIRQIVGNLISNAVKYTKRGTVTLSVDHAVCPQTGDPVLSFTVADTGTGMSREAVKHAFDAYTRADSAKRAGIEGLGLGLAISRTLTEALGGALSVESEPGVGSRFSLTVPVLPGDPALAGKDDALPSGADLARNVLVIDDHAVNLIVARGYLERLGCRVIEAATGAAGVAASAAQRFDLVLIDHDLPDMPGADVAARIAQAGDPPLLVALTAHLIEDTPDNRARLGVARILSKPISPRALAQVLSAGPASPAPPDPGGVLDGLREDMADLGAGTTAQILAAFLDDLPGALDAIRTGPQEAQRKAAHKLKGAASNFRLTGLCNLLASVEASEGGASEDLLDQVTAAAWTAATQLKTAAGRLGLQTVSGSTK